MEISDYDLGLAVGWALCWDAFAGLIGGRIFSALPDEVELARWSVRGQPRSRATFGLPHPGDFPGRVRTGQRVA